MAAVADSAGSAHTAIMAEKHPKRPRDVNQWAKRMVEIATGQVEDREPTPEEQGKDPGAVALGRKGGTARAKAMTHKPVPINGKIVYSKHGRFEHELAARKFIALLGYVVLCQIRGFEEIISVRYHINNFSTELCT